MSLDSMKAPFPWFGGKRCVADVVWKRFGLLDNYVEPFFGSGAVLLGAPRVTKFETINDIDGYVCNFWRAIKNDPDGVVDYCNTPQNENDYHARHAWLVTQKNDLVQKLEGNPDFYDIKIAGWWVWGICLHIGGGFVSGKGPWRSVGGKLLKTGEIGGGLKRCLPRIGRGNGVHRFFLRDGCGSLADTHRQNLRAWFAALQERLRFVRVTCGDWSRICGRTPTTNLGLTGVFLDPPYSDLATRDKRIYATDSLTVAHDVRRWCLERGDDPRMRIALCGYEGEHEMPENWECVAWKAQGGHANRSKTKSNKNNTRERIWFSPHCLSGKRSLFLDDE